MENMLNIISYDSSKSKKKRRTFTHSRIFRSAFVWAVSLAFRTIVACRKHRRYSTNFQDTSNIRQIILAKKYHDSLELIY